MNKAENKPKNRNPRPVTCLETGVTYSSSRVAADRLILDGIDVCPKKILSACSGERKRAGGLRWAYATPLSTILTN